MRVGQPSPLPIKRRGGSGSGSGRRRRQAEVDLPLRLDPIVSPLVNPSARCRRVPCPSDNRVHVTRLEHFMPFPATVVPFVEPLRATGFATDEEEEAVVVAVQRTERTTGTATASRQVAVAPAKTRSCWPRPTSAASRRRFTPLLRWRRGGRGVFSTRLATARSAATFSRSSSTSSSLLPFRAAG